MPNVKVEFINVINDTPFFIFILKVHSLSLNRSYIWITTSKSLYHTFVQDFLVYFKALCNCHCYQLQAMDYFVDNDYSYELFSNHSLFTLHKDLGIVASSEMVHKLNNTNKWPNFSYFSHDKFDASNACDMGESPLVQLECQDIDLTFKEETQEINLENNQRKHRRRRSRRNIPPRQRALLNNRRRNCGQQLPPRLQLNWQTEMFYY